MKELELILQAMTQLGAAGKEAFVWWLLMDKGLSFLGWVCTLIVFAFVVARIAREVNNSKELEAMRDQMNIGTRGMIVQSEIEQMRKWIAERTK